jgi:hypothetical protein
LLPLDALRRPACDSHKPTGERFRLADARGLSRQDQKRCLKSVVSIGGGKSTTAYRPNQWTMSLHNLSECRFVAIFDEASQQLRIRRRIDVAGPGDAAKMVHDRLQPAYTHDAPRRHVSRH